MSSKSNLNISAPEFMETAVNGWFKVIESQFHLKNISADKSKFHNIMAALPANVVARLPPDVLETTSYEKLKEAIVVMYEKSKPELLDKLMKSSSISGRPSAFLQELITLAAKLNVGEDIIRHKFLQALPSNIAPVIASQKEASLSALGSLADELMPLLQNQNVMAVSTEPTRNKRTRSTKEKENSDDSRYQTPMGLRPYNRNQRQKVCRPHIFYGPNAKYCKPWCKWPKKNNIKILPTSRPSSPTAADSSDSNF